MTFEKRNINYLCKLEVTKELCVRHTSYVNYWLWRLINSILYQPHN